MGTAHGFAVGGDHPPAVATTSSRTQPRNAASKAAGSRAAKTRPKVACEGMPLGSARKVRSQAVLAVPNRATSTQVSAPQILSLIHI